MEKEVKSVYFDLASLCLVHTIVESEFKRCNKCIKSGEVCKLKQHCYFDVLKRAFNSLQISLNYKPVD